MAGDVGLLRSEGGKHGFEVAAVPPVMMNGERVSSTRIRQAIRDGNLDAASRMLGRRYAVAGRVVEGRKLGRTIGFPTVNLAVADEQMPPDGVWTVRVRVDGEEFAGVANLGRRPTVGGSERKLEAHLFDFRSRPLRAVDRGGVRALPAGGEEVRLGRGTGGADRGGRGGGAAAGGEMNGARGDGRRWQVATALIEDRRLGWAMVLGGAVYGLLSLSGWDVFPCPFKTVTGLPCPGCGMTRACGAALRGDWAQVLELNPFGPLFLAFWGVVTAGLLLPGGAGRRFAGWLGRIESFTRWPAWVMCRIVILHLDPVVRGLLVGCRKRPLPGCSSINQPRK